jgi:hypothetical protein
MTVGFSSLLYINSDYCSFLPDKKRSLSTIPVATENDFSADKSGRLFG